MKSNTVYNTDLVDKTNDSTSQPGRVKWPDVMSVHSDVPCVHIVESFQ